MANDIVWDDAKPDAGIVWDDAPPKQALPKTLGQNLKAGVGNIMAAPEILANLGTGTIGQAVGGLAGLAGAALPGPQGQGAAWSQKVSNALTYQPQTDAAQTVLGGVGKGFEYANEKLGQAGEAVGGNVGRSIGENALPVAMTVAPIPKMLRQARAVEAAPKAGFTSASGQVIPAEDVAFARANTGKMEALEAAKRHGISLDPMAFEQGNKPSLTGKLAEEGKVSERLSKANTGKVEDVVRKDLGIEYGQQLDVPTLKAVRADAARAQEPIRALGNLTTDDVFNNAIKSINIDRGVIGADAKNTLLSRHIGEVEAKTGKGIEATDALESIRSLRKDASDVYKSTSPDPEALAVADAKLKTAQALEGVIERNLETRAEASKNPYNRVQGEGDYSAMLNSFRDSRSRMAKSYSVESALDNNTFKVDPLKIAKMTAEDNALTGGLADVGQIAGNFPEVFNSSPKVESGILGTHLYRRSVPALAGAGIGGAVGGVPGAAMGATLGEGAGRLTALGASKRLASPALQERLMSGAVPRDLWEAPAAKERIIAQELRKQPDVEIGIAQQDGAPLQPQVRQNIDPSVRATMELADSESPMLKALRAPDRTDGAHIPVNDNMVEFSPGANTEYSWGGRQVNQPAADAHVAALRNAKWQTLPEKLEATARATGMAEEAAARQAEAAIKVRSKGEFSRNEPVIIGGESPTVAQPIIGKQTSLQSAVEKIASGRKFDLTAEERIAWSKANGTIEALRKGKD